MDENNGISQSMNISLPKRKTSSSRYISVSPGIQGSQRDNSRVFFAFNTKNVSKFDTFDAIQDSTFKLDVKNIDATIQDINKVNRKFCVELNSENDICFQALFCDMTKLVRMLKKVGIVRNLDLKDMKRYVDSKGDVLIVIFLECQDSEDDENFTPDPTPRTLILKEMTEKVEKQIHEGEIPDEEGLVSIDFRSPRTQVLEFLGKTVGDSLPGRGIDVLEPPFRHNNRVERVDQNIQSRGWIRTKLKAGFKWIVDKL